MVSDYDCPCEVSDSAEDLLGLSPSLRNSEYFKDLEEGISASQFTGSPATKVPESQALTLEVQASVNSNSTSPDNSQPAQTSLTARAPEVNEAPPSYCIHPAEEPHSNFLVDQLYPKLPGCTSDSGASSGPAAGLDLTTSLNGLLGTMEAPNGVSGSGEVKEQNSMDLDGELDMDSFPILVRSMSTSRRHSWGVPLSPINLGRR